MSPLRIGSFTPAAPVVLAPMAGVTNRAFRAMCRSYGPDLVYVNEMVMATAVVHRNPKTLTMMAFGPDEWPRSLQLYGSDPEIMGRAVHLLCDEGRVDHIDLNFGCPAAKVTRRGGGAAVPARPELLRAVLRAAVTSAANSSASVTEPVGLWGEHTHSSRARSQLSSGTSPARSTKSSRSSTGSVQAPANRAPRS